MKARFFRVTPEPMQVIGVTMKVPVRLIGRVFHKNTFFKK